MALLMILSLRPLGINPHLSLGSSLGEVDSYSQLASQVLKAALSPRLRGWWAILST